MIKSVTVNGQTFAVGRCVPGDINQTIARIEQNAPMCYACFDESGHLVAGIDNCPAIVVYEQKEAPGAVTP